MNDFTPEEQSAIQDIWRKMRESRAGIAPGTGPLKNPSLGAAQTPTVNPSVAPATPPPPSGAPAPQPDDTETSRQQLLRGYRGYSGPGWVQVAGEAGKNPQLRRQLLLQGLAKMKARGSGDNGAYYEAANWLRNAKPDEIPASLTVYQPTMPSGEPFGRPVFQAPGSRSPLSTWI